MLIKEYRIPLPLTVEEYRIAQLYMIAKKSKQESKGADSGSGVEILRNEPYTDGPGGSGQLTHKVYHIGSHLPGWFKSLLPASALTVEERAWNAYPYTKTVFSCPFVEKFSLEIETYYLPDGGQTENIFKLSESELSTRVVDLIDVVRDQDQNYVAEEDLTTFVSEKTARGPLDKDWLETYSNACVGQWMPTGEGHAVMCAYKLCKVEFRYWGMQGKIERFIHDMALRNTMLRAHRQAWVWQDEWYGLTMDDIREIERKTAEELKKKMRGDEEEDDVESVSEVTEDSQAVGKNFSSIENNTIEIPNNIAPRQTNQRKSFSECSIGSGSGMRRSRYSSERLNDVNHIERIVRQGESGVESDEEFFDCHEVPEDIRSLTKWNSMELVPEQDESGDSASTTRSSSTGPELRRTVSYQYGSNNRNHKHTRPTIELADLAESSCPTSFLILVLHGGCILDTNTDNIVRKSDVTTLRGAFESIMRQHYQGLVGRLVMKCIPCPPICDEALSVLSSLSPYSDNNIHNNDTLPISCIPVLATSRPDYQESVSQLISLANKEYQDFLQTEEGFGFSGQVCILADSVGSLLAYDALCRQPNQTRVDTSEGEDDDGHHHHHHHHHGITRQSSIKTQTKNNPHLSVVNDINATNFHFDVSHFFLLGSPLPIVLAYRQNLGQSSHVRPNCVQMYNLFHPSNPVVARMEPLLVGATHHIPPVNIPRYQMFPLGDGARMTLADMIQSHQNIFSGQSSSRLTPIRTRRMSSESIQSGLFDTQQAHIIADVKKKWWGTKRLDYAVYCPEGIANFPSNSLPHLFHASFWESADVISFILRQITISDNQSFSSTNDSQLQHVVPTEAREKWIKKRTSVKIRNGTANHRGNDVIVLEGRDQVLHGRFSYGPFDMSVLSGEKVDIHIMKEPPNGKWTLLSTQLTDKTGRVSFKIQSNEKLGSGVYPVNMVVRGDHTVLALHLAVVPSQTEAVVFSIDGSFTASVSVTGKDPKVRPCSVDLVRHWQDLGYLIIYVTGRPCMQLRKVVSWLSMHNFPQGLVSFADGISTDPLGHKREFLQKLQQENSIAIRAGYGSSKDINVYSSVGLRAEDIHIVGKISKKQMTQCNHLSEGYAAHLVHLAAPGGSRPAQGNGRMVIMRSNTVAGGSSVIRQNSLRVTYSKFNSLPASAPIPSPVDKIMMDRSSYS